MIWGHINSILLIYSMQSPVEQKFPSLFSHSTESQVFAAAVACHRKIPKYCTLLVNSGMENVLFVT